MPEGRWTDFFTGRIYRGGRWITMYRDLDSIPVLAGEGAIVPMYHSGETNDLSLEQPLDIHIWRGNGSFRLFEDDGESNSASHAVTPMAVTEEGETLRFVIGAAQGDRTLLPETRYFNLIFRDIRSARVLVNGQTVPFSQEGIPLLAEPSKEIFVELRDITTTVNPPRKTLRTALFTRIQGEVIWKNAVLNSPKKQPGFVRDALAEMDALLYEQEEDIKI
jgi:hypothetical protein